MSRGRDAGPPVSSSLPAARRRRAWRRLLLLAIAVLYVAAIPWYREAEDPVELVFGLPDWFVVALCCYAAAAVLNAIAWWLSDLEDPEPGSGCDR